MHAVSSGEGKVILVTASGECETFDHIIFACHSGDALRIVDAGGGATPGEREILSTFQWVTNDLWLHSDENVGVDSLSCFAPEMAANLEAYQLMPRKHHDWSTVNYLKHTKYDKQRKEKANDPHLSVSFALASHQPHSCHDFENRTRT